MSAEWIVAIILAIVLVVVILFAASGSRAWQRTFEQYRMNSDAQLGAKAREILYLEGQIANLRSQASAYEISRDVAVDQADGTRALLAAVIARFVFDDVGLPVTYSLTAEEIETARPRRVFCHTNGATGEVTLSVQRAGATPSRGEFL